MKYTRYSLLVFTLISLFFITFFETSGGYWFFVNTFPIVLMITGVVFIEEALGPKKTQVDAPSRQGALGIAAFNLWIAAIIFCVFQFRTTNNIYKELILLIAIGLFFFFIFKTFQRIPYTLFNQYIKQAINYHYFTTFILLSFVFGLFYFKFIYIPHSDYEIAPTSEMSFYRSFSSQYASFDDAVNLTRDHSLTTVSFEDLTSVYDAYFKALGGVEITTTNAYLYAVSSFEDEEAENIYKKRYLSQFQESEIRIENRVLIIKPKCFYYGLSGNIFKALNNADEFDTVLYDLSDVSGGLVTEALYSSDPILPLNTFTKIEVNPELKTINNSFLASSDFVTDKSISLMVNEGTQSLGLLIASNASANGYDITGNLDPRDDIAYEVIYLNDVEKMYAYPIGRLKNLNDQSLIQ